MKLSIKKLFLIFIAMFSHGKNNASQPKSIVPTISTLQEALFNIRKVIINYPNDSQVIMDYEKNSARILSICAKVLCDYARQEILQTLEEIDNRLAYWQYQKNHEWAYFLMKNPFKWFTGPHQKVEIEHNIEQLQSHQGELYVLLGQLAEHGNIYDREYKTVFAANYTKAYAWIDELLNLLARLKVATQQVENMSPFIARATLLKLKLTKVRYFKNSILSEMSETQIPAHIEQNWLKYGALTFALGYGYKNIGMQQIIDSFESVKSSFNKLIIEPIQTTIKDVLGGHSFDEGELLEKNVVVAKQSIKNFVNKLSVTEETWSGLGDITLEQKKTILDDIELGKSGSFQALVDHLATGWNPKKVAEASALFYKFIGLQGLSGVQKQSIGLFKIAFLTPAILSSIPAYFGYKKLTAKNYSSIRQALIDINSLFVDTTKPLDDERYGKMIYLVYSLKKQAEKNVPLTDRADFIEDLHKIELKEFDVAAKRHIVDDMFRKYSFLKMS